MKKLFGLVVLLLGIAVATQTTYADECEYEAEYGTHNYVPVGNKFPTCTEDGYIEVACESCGATKRDSIIAYGHNFGGWRTERDATCEHSGLRVRTCGECGFEDTEVISNAAMEHNFEQKDAKSPTCTVAGYSEFECTKCGTTKRDTVPAKGHSYSGWNTLVNANCGKEGKANRTCSECGAIETRTIPAQGTHNYKSTVTKEATATETGIMTYICSVCNDRQTAVIPMIKGGQVEIPTVNPVVTPSENWSEDESESKTESESESKTEDESESESKTERESYSKVPEYNGNNTAPENSLSLPLILFLVADGVIILAGVVGFVVSRRK